MNLNIQHSISNSLKSIFLILMPKDNNKSYLLYVCLIINFISEIFKVMNSTKIKWTKCWQIIVFRNNKLLPIFQMQKKTIKKGLSQHYIKDITSQTFWIQLSKTYKGLPSAVFARYFQYSAAFFPIIIYMHTYKQKQAFQQ